MKAIFKILLWVSFVLLIGGCAGGRLQITKAQMPLRSFEDIPQKDISIARVKQELREGHFDSVKRVLDVISKEGYENEIEIHMYRGILYYYQNRLQSALNEFEKSLNLLVPTVEQAIQKDLYENAGYLYYDLNDYKKAAVYLRKCKELGGEVEEADIEFFEKFQGTPYRIETQDQRANLKMDYKGIPIVKGSINGSKELSFIVDTGAQMTVLSSEMANKLKIKPLVSGSKGAGAGGEFSVDLGVIDSLRLGDVIVRNVPVTIIDSKELTFKLFGLLTIFKIDGVIGLPLLKQFDVTFDYKGKRLILDIPQKTEEPSSFEGNFYLVRDKIMLPVGINGIEGFTFMLDTGGGGDHASITPEGLEELKDQQLKISEQLGGSWGAGGGGVKKIKDVKDVSLRMCGFDIRNVDLRVDKDPIKDKLIEIDGFIENMILENFKVKMDFRKMQITLVD
ncbi:MAG: aspartyl protease family protein [bacterium]